MLHTEWKVILGPPGTGKTSKLLTIMQECLSQGIHPKEIGFVSFTKKAAEEARGRAKEVLDYPDEDFLYFRTLHSLAFRFLGLRPLDVMRGQHYNEFGGIIGYRLSGNYQRILDDDFTAVNTLGDKFLFLDNLSRIQEVPLRQTFDEAMAPGLAWDELERFSKAYVLYKKQRCLVDFSDMIIRFGQENFDLPIRVLFVDEAQDLSRSQWKMVYKLAEGCEKVFVAGDDDQAIFQWAGADVTGFNDVPGERLVLEQSYRIPLEVHKVAHYVRSQIKNSYPKAWNARAERGLVKSHMDLARGNFDLGTGNWLLLARNNVLLKPLEELCLNHGYNFTSPTSPLNPDIVDAIVTWERLRAGKEALIGDVALVYGCMVSNKGYRVGSRKLVEQAIENGHAPVTLENLKSNFGLWVESPWFEALAKIPSEHVGFYRSILKRGERLTGAPRIKISTIHGAKGGEADNVLLVTDMTPKTLNNLSVNPDSEHRVWYVGVTRARHSLHLVRPERRGYNTLGDLQL